MIMLTMVEERRSIAQKGARAILLTPENRHLEMALLSTDEREHPADMVPYLRAAPERFKSRYDIVSTIWFS